MKKISKKLLSVLLIIAMLIPTGALVVNTSAATVSIPDDASYFNGHYYKAYEDRKTWEEAKTYCESLGGHLVTITSQAENDFITTIFPPLNGASSKSYYIGYNDIKHEGVWEWVTSESNTFSNWGIYQPDNFDGAGNDQNATVITSGTFVSGVCVCNNGEWDDAYVGFKTNLICEWEPKDQTITGTLTGGSTQPKIAIDGTWYEYDTSVSGLADAIDEFAAGSTITCKIRFGKIVACSKKEITNAVTMSMKASNSTIDYDSRTSKYSPESTKLSLTISNNVKNSNGGKVDQKYLAGYDVTFDKIVFNAKNGNMLYFEKGLGEPQTLEKELKKPVTLKAGETYTLNEEILLYVKNEYNWSDSDKTKEVQLTATAYNGDTMVAFSAVNITFNNKNSEILAANVTDLNAKLDKAAKNLKQTSGVMSDAYLESLISKEDWQEVTNALKCKVALSSTVLNAKKNSTFEEKLIDKLMSKAGISKSLLGSVYTTDITYSVSGETKENGRFTVNFNIELTNVEIGKNNPFVGYSFDTTYEIKGGKNIDKDKRTGSILSWFSYANIQTFADSITEVALEQVEYAFNLGYGNDFNKVCGMFFDDTVTEILSRTALESYSHTAYEAMTYPTKKASIHCPVDVYVYDAEGTLCASVENNEITLTCENIDIEVVGDEKYLTIYDGNYSIEIIATATSTMDVEIEEYLSKDRILRTNNFNNIEIEPGDSFKTAIDEDYFFTTYTLTKNEEEIISADSEESSIHYVEHVEVTDKKATCTQNGEYHIECENCKETILTGIIPATGHSDADHNGICDNCGDDFTKTCSCNCHGNAFMQFIHKILCFIYKLFGMTQYQYCDCGKAHW